jgi:hypothetical protein
MEGIDCVVTFYVSLRVLVVNSLDLLGGVAPGLSCANTAFAYFPFHLIELDLFMTLFVNRAIDRCFDIFREELGASGSMEQV